VTLRAEVPNADGALLPGQYVRARVAQSSLPAAMLVPQQAVTRGTQGDTVIIVTPDGKTGPRPIKISTQQGNKWVVLEGIKEGELIVVDGFQKMQAPGMTVKPVPWSATPAPATAAAPAAATK
jgi:membrane fusion protein (multidrug efflux system)